MSRYDNDSADAEASESAAGAASVVTGAAVGQSQGGTGSLQTGFTETGHANQSDVNTTELISTLNGLIAAQSIEQSRFFNTIDGLAAANAQSFQAALNAQTLRNADLAADRQWNVNETDAFATILAARVAELLNPTS